MIEVAKARMIASVEFKQMATSYSGRYDLCGGVIRISSTARLRGLVSPERKFNLWGWAGTTTGAGAKV